MNARISATAQSASRRLAPPLSARAGQRRFYYVNGHYQTLPHAWDNGYPMRPEPAGAVQHIAVIGGGITGLAAAYELARRDGGEEQGSSSSSSSSPRIKVSVFEASDRLGGWLQSSWVDLPASSGGGRVLLEAGPRTLRAGGSPNVLALIDRLGLYGEVLATPRTAAAARNRYVLLRDGRLARMPSSVLDVARVLLGLDRDLAWVRDGLLTGLLRPTARARGAPLLDGSVADVMGASFNGAAQRIASAVMHGIYAGDTRRLSAAALLPSLHKITHFHDSMLIGIVAEWFERRMGKQRVRVPDPRDLIPFWDLRPAEPDKMEALRKMSVYSFKRGLQQLSDTLEAHLTANPDDVTIHKKTSVSNIEVRPGRGVTIRTADGRERRFGQALCTLSSKALSRLVTAPAAPAGGLARLRSLLEHNPSVTVMVVNLYFAEPDLLPVRGFGFLIEAGVAEPEDVNPEGALGVVFDSDAIQGQDEVARPGTKLTVMLGGHQWDVLKEMGITPTAEEGIRLARDVVRRHLGITAAPAAAKATLQADCIPQYYVGHLARMGELHKILVGDGFRGDVMVGGSSYTGVSVDDCFGAGLTMARMVKRGILDSGLMAPPSGHCERHITTGFDV